MALAGKIAAITASTKGIGLACVERFLNEGAVVYLSSRKQMAVNKEVDRLHEKFGPDKVFGTACHVGDEKQRKNLYDMIDNNHGKLDILVSNAANNNHFGSIFTCNKNQWSKIFDVNVTSTACLINEFLPLLEQSKLQGGNPNIICTSSITAVVKTEFIGPYAVSKAALTAMVRQMSPELAQKGIRINSVEPGVVKTDFAEVLHNPESPYNKILQQFDQKRAGKSEEVANLVKFLASDEASFITGEAHRICGGSPGW